METSTVWVARTLKLPDDRTASEDPSDWNIPWPSAVTRSACSGMTWTVKSGQRTGSESGWNGSPFTGVIAIIWFVG